MGNDRPSRSKKPCPRKAPRLPRDYPWKVADVFVRSVCTPPLAEKLLSAIRARSWSDYMKCGEEWSLQSMASLIETLGFNKARCLYHGASIIRKFDDEGDDSSSKEELATVLFREAEEKCRETNRRFRIGYPFTEPLLLNTAKLFVSQVLGPSLPPIVDVVDCRHGPGASVGATRETDAYFKYASLPYACPTHALGLARLFILADERWCRALVARLRPQHDLEGDLHPSRVLRWDRTVWSEILAPCDSNRVCFVPKDREKFRTIGVEPVMGTYLGLGYDSWIRGRLRVFGIDLNDQTKNQEAARLGSMGGSFATIDLSMASDTLCTELCRAILPHQWFMLLMALRSSRGSLKGEFFSYEKISSMGNALTFSMETLVFLAICWSALRCAGIPFTLGRNLLAYGDDLIIPCEGYEAVSLALREAGFSVNDAKSFFEGRTRESCGKEFHNGTPIRPLFLRRKPNSLEEFIAQRNHVIVSILSLGGKIKDAVDLFDAWAPPGIPRGPYKSDRVASWFFSQRGRRTPDVHGAFHIRAVHTVQITEEEIVDEYSLLLKNPLRSHPPRPAVLKKYRRRSEPTDDPDGYALVSRRNRLRTAINSTAVTLWPAGEIGG